jgi:hypothetical protein
MADTIDRHVWLARLRDDDGEVSYMPFFYATRAEAKTDAARYLSETGRGDFFTVRCVKYVVSPIRSTDNG